MTRRAGVAAPPRHRRSRARAVVRAKRKPNALSSLENNMIVTEILEAARESAKTHGLVRLDRE